MSLPTGKLEAGLRLMCEQYGIAYEALPMEEWPDVEARARSAQADASPYLMSPGPLVILMWVKRVAAGVHQ